MYESSKSSVSLTAAVVNLGTEFVMRGSALGAFSLNSADDFSSLETPVPHR